MTRMDTGAGLMESEMRIRRMKRFGEAAWFVMLRGRNARLRQAKINYLVAKLQKEKANNAVPDTATAAM